MTDNPDTLRYSDLLHKPVLSKGSTHELGWVEVIWMHPPAHQVLGFICRPSLLGSKRLAFNLNQLKTVGQATVVINSDPVEATTDQLKLLKTLIGLELWDDQGQALGRIVDCVFDRRTGLIRDYLFRNEGWREFVGDLYQVPVHQIISFDKRRVYIAADSDHWLTFYEEGWETKVSEVGDRLRENYTEATQSFTEQAKEATQQANQRLRTWAGTFKQQVQSFTEQATETAKSFVDEWEGEDFQNPDRPNSKERHRSKPSLLHQIKKQAIDLKGDLQDELKPIRERFTARSQSPQKRSANNTTSENPRKEIPSDDWDDEDPWI